MDTKAQVKHIRISPRKVRLVTDVVRGMNTGEALNQLTFVNKRAVLPVRKLIESAIANAKNNFNLSESNLFVKEIRVDEGRTMKRWMPRARGRATPIRKRTSHISLILGEIKDSGTKEAKKQKIEAPVKLDGKKKEDPSTKGKKLPEESNPSASSGQGKKDTEEKGHGINDPRGEGRGKNTKIEGKSEKGFSNKVFRRKSG